MQKARAKKSITTNELVKLMMDGFDRVEAKLSQMVTFTQFEDFKNEVNQRFNAVDHRFNLVDDRFYEIDQRFNKLDRDYDGRLDLVEHRLIAVKNTIITDLETPIRW